MSALFSADATIFSTSSGPISSISPPARPLNASLCSIAFITLAADSSTSARRSWKASAMVSSTR